MIKLMEIFALIAGILFSLYLFGRSADNILTLMYLSVFRSKERFGHLYGLADDKVTYSFIGTQLEGVTSFTDYFRLHESARPTSFKHFCRYYDSLATLLLKRYLPVVLVPVIPFWSYWYAYLIGVLITLTGLVSYKTFVKARRAGFYQRLVIFATIKDYQKSMKKKSK